MHIGMWHYLAANMVCNCFDRTRRRSHYCHALKLLGSSLTAKNSYAANRPRDSGVAPLYKPMARTFSLPRQPLYKMERLYSKCQPLTAVTCVHVHVSSSHAPRYRTISKAPCRRRVLWSLIAFSSEAAFLLSLPRNPPTGCGDLSRRCE